MCSWISTDSRENYSSAKAETRELKVREYEDILVAGPVEGSPEMIVDEGTGDPAVRRIDRWEDRCVF